MGQSQPADGTWRHLATTYDAKSGFGKIYVDGVVENNSGFGKPDLAVIPDKIGIGTGSDGGHFLKGVLDELCIWKVELTEDEIKETMNGLSNILKGFSVEPQRKLATLWGKIRLR